MFDYYVERLPSAMRPYVDINTYREGKDGSHWGLDAIVWKWRVMLSIKTR